MKISVALRPEVCSAASEIARIREAVSSFWRYALARQKQVSVVRTAQMADTLKLIVDGRVAGTISVIDGATAALRDAHDRMIGTYGDTATAIAAFERSIEVHETGLGL